MKWQERFSQLHIPLAVKLTVIMTSLVSVCIGSSTWVSIYRNQKIFRQELEQQADILLTTLSISTADSFYFGNVELVKDIIDELTTQEALLSSRAYQEDGRVIADTEIIESHAFSLNPDPLGQKILQSKQTLYEWRSDRLLASKPIILGNKAVGAIAVELSTKSLKNKNIAERNQSIILGLILASIGTAISLWLGKSITDPLIQLTKVTKKITQGQLNYRIEIQSNDELFILANSFNAMTAKLKKLIGSLEQSEQLAFQKANELEETLIRLQRAKDLAEAANIAKSQFLSNMSHELRTPLNGILGYAQILNRDRTLTPKQIKGVKTILNSGSHLLTLINDILDLSKIEAGKLELFSSDIHLENFINSIVGIMAMTASAKNLEFNCQIAADLPRGIHADEKRLRQILLNLLSNAIKFTNCGQVNLNISLVTEDLLPNQKTLHFEVVDTGIGINLEKLNQIFRPFEQVGEAKHQAKGTGLGLSISKQLVELMGGNLQVDSEIGKGSRFWFDITIPVIESTSVMHQLEADRPLIVGYRGKRRRILVVDDKEENRLVLLNMLEPLGFEIFMAADGQAEVDLARQIKPDCILTDLVMPIKTGLEAIREVRQIPAIQDTIILAISASVLHSDESQIIGCEAFLSKPVEEEQLLNLLQRYLELDWIYETANESDLSDQLTPTTTLTTEIALPPEEVKILYELAMLGSMKKIRERASYLEQLDKNYAPLALQLQDLANSFQEKAIINLIESLL